MQNLLAFLDELKKEINGAVVSIDIRYTNSINSVEITVNWDDDFRVTSGVLEEDKILSFEDDDSTLLDAFVNVLNIERVKHNKINHRIED